MKEEYILMFDFGHGTRKYTKGKCSPDFSIYEGEWNREVGKRIFKEMRKLDIDCRIIVHEDEDISLQERCNRANKIVNDNPGKKCLYISIHINAAGNEGKWLNARGWSVWVARNASSKSKKLAKTLYDTALEMHLEGNRSIPAEHYWVAGYKVLRDTLCPAVLTENMFMDNKEDCKFLLSEEGKEKIVNLHIIGLCNIWVFLMDTPKDKKKTWLYEAFSEKGVGSAKRLAGMFLIFVSMCCIVYLTIIEGASPLVQDLIQTSLITGAALLGLHSITSIWKNGSMSVGEGNVSYSGEDSKAVLDEVLNKDKQEDLDVIMDDGEDETRPNRPPHHHRA